jgi:hypothetical protein
MLYINLVPIITGLVGQVERLARGTELSGEEKKQMALEMLGTAWTATGEFGKVKELKAVPFDIISPIASALIDSVVVVANLLGGRR